MKSRICGLFGLGGDTIVNSSFLLSKYSIGTTIETSSSSIGVTQLDLEGDC